MNFAERIRKLDALRLQQSAKATVQFNGRLSFTMEAGKVMGLSDDKSIVIFSDPESDDLGAVISVKDDPEAFVLKKCGPYFYLSFRNYLRQANLDYKRKKIIYDITQLEDKIDGKPLFRFECRMLDRDMKEVTEAESREDDDDEGETASVSADTGAQPVDGESTHQEPTRDRNAE